MHVWKDWVVTFFLATLYFGIMWFPDGLGRRFAAAVKAYNIEMLR